MPPGAAALPLVAGPATVLTVQRKLARTGALVTYPTAAAKETRRRNAKGWLPVCGTPI